ncbi:MAG: nucleotidyltransferase family protein [Methanocorpusculum sp.]|nr:nucleotidyltransferase family protein [Methanocorpusculum sp.]
MNERLPEIRERFGIETIVIFGSVAREEDRADSDIDIIVTFRHEYDTYMNFLLLSEYLEQLFGRNVDLLTERSICHALRPYIQSDLIQFPAQKTASVSAIVRNGKEMCVQ